MAFPGVTGEVKYFLSNRVPGRKGWSLRKILRVAVGHWPVEDCFREAKNELGLEHLECRMWQCIHRHLYFVILSHLCRARVREKYSASENVLDGDLLPTEQVRRAMNVVLEVHDQPPRLQRAAYEVELTRQQYYQGRNGQAWKPHRKQRGDRLLQLAIDPDRIKTVNRKPPK